MTTHQRKARKQYEQWRESEARRIEAYRQDQTKWIEGKTQLGNRVRALRSAGRGGCGVKRKAVDLAHFVEASKIVRTGKDSKGRYYNEFGILNQSAWIGERSHLLISEIQLLRNVLRAVLNCIEAVEDTDNVRVLDKRLRKQVRELLEEQ